MPELGKLLQEEEAQTPPDLHDLEKHWHSMRALIHDAGTYEPPASRLSYRHFLYASLVVLAVFVFIEVRKHPHRNSAPLPSTPTEESHPLPVAADTSVQQLSATDTAHKNPGPKSKPTLGPKKGISTRPPQQKSIGKISSREEGDPVQPSIAADSVHPRPHSTKRRARKP